MAKHTVKLKSYVDINNEYNAASAVTPGELIEVNSSGKVKAHANAGQNVLPMFAFEDELQGNGIDDDYDADDPVQCWIPRAGDEVYAFLADGEDASQGDFLESDGNGALQVHTADSESIGTDSSGAVNSFYTNQIVGVAMEDLDLSGSSGTRQRIKVRII